MTARDAAGNTGTDTLTVTYTPPDTTTANGNPYHTDERIDLFDRQFRLNIGGTASDNAAVTSVSWTNSRGGSGTCSGTNTWSKSGIVLSSGQNVITVTARKMRAGNTAPTP